MSMRRILPSIAIVLALAASAEGEVKRSQYLVAIGSHAQKSTVTALGATIDADLNDTWLVSVDPANVELLRSLPGVRYVQRVVVPNAETPAAPEPEATAFASSQHHAGAYSLTWSSGDYGYDGAGNVTSIGTGNSYRYDGDSRLMHATTAGHTQDYSYDGFGNMTSMMTDSQPHSLATTTSTNRLNANLYDVAGNVKKDEFGYDYVYDAFNMIQDKRQGLEIDIYDGSDERVGMLRNGKWTWTLRDESGKVLREYQTSDATPSAPALWLGDYVWRDGLMAGSQRVVEEGGSSHYHLDHLGTPRLITGTGGAVIARHDFYPYGGEITPSNSDTLAGMREDTFRFTGHERDFNSLASGDTDYLDYMHARYYNPNGGRFLSADPKLTSARANSPQTWNRYAYTLDNPVKYIDRKGEDVTLVVRDAGEGMTNFGHLGERVHGNGYDKTYDFGRYNGGRGFLKAKGDGILNIWSNFGGFLATQRGKGDVRTITFKTTAGQDQAVMEYFAKLTGDGTKIDKAKNYDRFKLSQDYDLRTHNCVTISMDALKYAEQKTGQKVPGLTDIIRNENDPRDIYKLLTPAEKQK